MERKTALSFLGTAFLYLVKIAILFGILDHIILAFVQIFIIAHTTDNFALLISLLVLLNGELIIAGHS